MSLFSEKGIMYTIATVGINFAVNIFGKKIKDNIYPENIENEMIRKYLLNDSPLYGYNRPKLWVHTTYEYNARKWKSFGSRSSTNLNQPYIHATVKSIINHCGDDFNVCLIDDDSFSQLIPGCTTQVSELAEPMRHNYRELAMAELLYIYGGFIVPNTFVCMHNLITLYSESIVNDKPFVCELQNHSETINSHNISHAFSPSCRFMGAPKRCPMIREMVEYLRKRNENPHFSAEPDFFGYTSRWLENEIVRNNIVKIDGIYVGSKTIEKKPVLIEDLVGDKLLEFCPTRTYGVYIPGDDFLKRSCYKWFAVMSLNEILQTNMAVANYLSISMIENKPNINSESESKTVVSI